MELRNRTFAKPSPSGIEVLPYFVPDLAARGTSSVLPAVLEAHIPVRPHHSVVKLGAVHIPHAVLGVLPGVVLHEAEPTGSHLVPV